METFIFSLAMMSKGVTKSDGLSYLLIKHLVIRCAQILGRSAANPQAVRGAARGGPGNTMACHRVRG